VAGDRSLIAHLFRRAGFGATPAELDHYQAAGFTVAVEELLSGEPIMGRQPPLYEGFIQPTVVRPATDLVERVVVIRSLDQIQTEWLAQMVTSVRPLVDRITLMLHDHFATGYSPGDYIDAPELTAQNRLLGQHALGNWGELCHAMLEDVAMGMWLDADRNVADAPNENLARELMELFMLGVDGGYTEFTVREAARALTGYFLDFNLDPLGARYKMTFDPLRHDDGTKNLFGQVGEFMPHDVVDILLAQPAASRHLARRLITTLVSPTPSATFVEQIAATLRSSSWELKPALRAILTSPEFAANQYTLVRSPAEFIAAAWRALGVTDYTTGNYWMRRAGQGLYDPPNVGGWVANEGWLPAGFMLARYNAAVQLGSLHLNQFRLLGETAVRGTSAQQWGEIFGMTELAPATKSALDSYLGASKSLGHADAQIDLGAITLIVSSPDFSLA
jgi:uncharacterized protein (DUF1800 family)